MLLEFGAALPLVVISIVHDVLGSVRGYLIDRFGLRILTGELLWVAV